MKFKKFSAVVLSALFLLLMAMGFATKAYDEDAQKIQVVIQSQLHAVMLDDAEMAFSFTSASSQDALGSPDDFMDLIRHELPMLYRHRRVFFEEPDIGVNRATQVVRFTDERDSVWIGVYRMLREKDGTWKVAGCQLIETASISI